MSKKPSYREPNKGDTKKDLPKRQASVEKQRPSGTSETKETRGTETPSMNKTTREDSRSLPTKIIGSQLTLDSGKERRVQFSAVARVKLIPSDQLPPRPVHMERSISNPKRRLWVLHRLCQLGGRYFPNKHNRQESVVIHPGTPWPSKWGEPPAPLVMIPMKGSVENETSSSDDSLSV